MRKLVLTAIAAVGLAAPAAAVAPTLSVTAADRRPQASFSAPRADDVTIYFASKPDRATDGRFFNENVETLDSMTDDEIANGRWVSESRLDPGTYYVMLRASPDFDRCYISETGDYDPACANGYSNVARLTVPKPPTRYTARAEVLSYAGVVHATLRASRLGENRAYRVCYRAVTRVQRCTRGTLVGYSWDSATDDLLRLSTRLMPNRTTLTWWVGTRRVAVRVVRVR
jgi:hypothetical protein